MIQFPVDRLLSMSSMTALVRVREYAASSGVAFQEAATSLLRFNAEYSNLDFEAAQALDSVIEGVSLEDQQAFYRLTLRRVIEMELPSWVRLASAGRSRLCQALSVNVMQSFRAAGLLEANPDLTVVHWWDEIAALARSEHDRIKLEQGRKAEALTLRLEQERLDTLGLGVSPRWVSIEDNSAGYDILSYDAGSHGPTARMIEVKSCNAMTLGFYISRTEWETAVRSQRYVIHLWKLPLEELIEIEAETVARSIPSDQGDGAWQIAYIKPSPS